MEDSVNSAPRWHARLNIRLGGKVDALLVAVTSCYSTYSACLNTFAQPCALPLGRALLPVAVVKACARDHGRW
jgi:hypothetical protein